MFLWRVDLIFLLEKQNFRITCCLSAIHKVHVTSCGEIYHNRGYDIIF